MTKEDYVADPVLLSIDGDVWAASVQAAVDAWFLEHPPEPEPGPEPPDYFDALIATPADYTALVAPLFGGQREPWFFGRGAGDDFNDPNGGPWESAQQPASTSSGQLHNLRTDRPVTIHARTVSGQWTEQQIQVPGALKPDTPPPVTGRRGLLGIYAYDQTLQVTKNLQATLAVPAPNADQPLLACLHLDHGGDWNRLSSVWFANDWRNAGAQYRLVITVPPWPSPMGNQFPAAARGDFDGQWRTILQNIANAFSSGAVNYEIWLRFAHEANCCYVWCAENNPNEYKQMWARWSPIARSVSPRFKLVYCPFYGAGDIGFDTIAPDPNLYDRTGMDYYGYKNWRESATIKYGTEWYGNWTTNVVRKPGGFYEANPATYPKYPTQDMPDEDAWMQATYDLCVKYGLDYISYCDSNADVRSYLPDFPNNLACFKRTFSAPPAQAGSYVYVRHVTA
jgi:hypothetical protein